MPIFANHSVVPYEGLGDLQTEKIKKLALASEEGMVLMKKTQQLAEEVRSTTHAPMPPTFAVAIHLPVLSFGYSCMLHTLMHCRNH